MDTIMDPYFEGCLQGLAHAEKVFRRCCEKEILRIQNDLKKSLWESLSCISRTDVKNLCSNGWQYTVTEHDCTGNTACNMFLKLCLKKLPLASKLNRDRFLRAMYLSSSWEFAKLFLEPWMHRFHGFEELDSFCLLVLLDNISSIRQDTSSDSERHKQWVDLYHAQLGKGRTLAEACFQEDTQHLTEAERDNFLQAIINILACLQDEDLDEAIGFIVEIRGTSNRDLALIDRTLEKRFRLQEMRQEFQKMMKDFVSTIPKEDAQSEETKILDRDLETQSCFSKEPFVSGVKLGKGIVDRKQMYQNLEDSTLIRHILRMGDPVDLFYLFYKKRKETESEYPHKGGEITKEKYLCIQGLIHLLEKNLATDITDIVCSLLGALKLSEFNLDVMPYSHYSKLQDVVKKMESTKPLKNLLQKEMEEANFKVYHLALLILESVLKPFCKNNLKRIHSDVKLCFTRTNLCQSATQNDICKANGMTSDKIRFRHACKETPDCNTFLDVSLSKRSDKCKLKPVAMFKYVNPHACLDNEWEFAKLFMEPYMHKLTDFEDFDAFCLLTLITNVQMFDAVQCNSNMLLEKICKVRDFAFAILHDNDTKLTKETRDECLQEIIDILTILKTTISGAGEALFKIKQLRGTLLFEIRLKLSSRKQWIISERNFSNWCKCVYALKYLQPALVPLVQEKMTDLHNDVIKDFSRNICADATSEDLRLKPKVGITFHHTCPKNEPPCNSLIGRIEKNFCLKSVSDIFNILKFTDPQNWLRSPFDFASLFLQSWMVQGTVDFSQCDISALCKLVKNCKPVSEMFKEMPINNVKRMRDRTMHCADFSISHIEMEERIDDILELLQMMFKSLKRDEVAVAIDLVGQLRTSDFKFSRDEGMRVYKETVASVKRRMHYKRDITCQSIKQMESDFGFISSGRNTNVSYCREHRHGQKRDIKEGWPLDRVFVSDEADHTPTVTTTEMERRPDSLPVKKHSDNISEATMDEDSGQGASSGASKPHDQGDENMCAKCGETGTVVSAAGFCRACSVYLCTNCLEHHKKSSATQDHELLEIVPMPLEDIAPFNVEKCKTHTSKPIEAYCADDNTFVCSLCLSISHRSCHNKGSLSDLSPGVESSQEFLDIKDAAERYKMLEKEYNDDIKLNLSRNYEWHTQTLEDFQKFRSVVNDKMEVEMDASKMIQENTRKLNDLAESTAKISEELNEYMATINKASQQNENQLFIALKKHGRHVHECIERLDTLHKEVLITKFGFKFDPTTRKSILKKRKVNIATFSRLTRTQLEEELFSRMLTQSSPKVLYTLATFLNIKSPEDSKDCNIMDIMELSPTELVMTDANNNCLKKLNTDSNKIIARCALQKQPKGIAQVRESVAVSFPQAKQIRFYKADLTPDVRKAIDVSAECHGLHWSNNLLIVSCINPAQVQILLETGKRVRIIENNPEGTLFQKPFHSILKRDARLIYVSDFDKHTLTCMDRVGIVQWEYRDEQLKGPEGMVTMDDGCIYLCSRETNTIHVVSPYGVKLAIIPISNSEIKHPCAAFYNNSHRTLYVCSESGNSEYGNFIGVVNLL